MKLQLKRKIFTPKSTIGELFIDGVFFCYTLEDVDRGLNQSDNIATIMVKKVFGVTAIPAGTYSVIVDMSNRFKKLMPLIKDVKGFAGVRIHTGNYPEQTEGCLLVGTQYGPDKVIDSRTAYNALFERLTACKEPITIEITRV